MSSVGHGLHTAPVPVNLLLGKLMELFATFVRPPNVAAFVRSQMRERYGGHTNATQA